MKSWPNILSITGPRKYISRAIHVMVMISRLVKISHKHSKLLTKSRDLAVAKSLSMRTPLYNALQATGAPVAGGWQTNTCIETPIVYHSHTLILIQKSGPALEERRHPKHFSLEKFKTTGTRKCNTKVLLN